MAANLTGPARRLKAAQAYGLAIARVSYTEIGKRLDISRNLVATLVKEEQERTSEERKDTERESAIGTYEAIIRYGWGLLHSEKLKANSLNQAGVMNSIASAQGRIDKITGVEAPTRSESTSEVNLTVHEGERDDEFERLFNELDAYRAQVDGPNSPGDQEKPLDTELPHPQTT